jgi:two-component system cell cycle sensor histidine kinase/response regulator CckA
MNPSVPGPTLLVVDDDAAVCFSLSFLLNNDGYSVIAASAGQEAIKLYREHWGKIAIVLLDIQMPDVDGLEVLAKLRQINPAVRVIFMSGYAEQLTQEENNRPGVVALLAKPFSIGSLLEALAAAGVVPGGYQPKSM